MPEPCCMHDYGCDMPATRRDDGTWACPIHHTVHIARDGSHVPDRHTHKEPA